MRDLPHRRAAVRVAIPLLGVALLAAACTDDDPIGDFAGLRVVHLAPGAPDVAVYLRGEPVALFEQITYAGSAPYAPLDPGVYDLVVAPSGAGPEAAVLAVDGIELDDGGFYTLAVIGGGDAGAGAPLGTILLIDERTPDVEGIARVRAIHAAPGVGEVEVSVTAQSGISDVIATELGYTDTSDYVDLGTIDAPVYWFSVDADADGDPDERLSIDMPFDANAINVFVALDAIGEPLLVVQEDRGFTVASGLGPRPEPQQAPQALAP